MQATLLADAAPAFGKRDGAPSEDGSQTSQPRMICLPIPRITAAVL
jgi:hypothetical protein